MKRYIAVIISLIGVVSFSSCSPIAGYPIGTFSERAKDPQSKCLKKNFMSIFKDESLSSDARRSMTDLGSPLYLRSTNILNTVIGCNEENVARDVYDSELQRKYRNLYEDHGKEVAGRFKDAYGSCGVDTAYMDMNAKIIPPKQCLQRSLSNADGTKSSKPSPSVAANNITITNNNSNSAAQSVSQKPARSTSISSGLSAIIDNPTMPANQALAICKPQAELAANRAASGVQSQNSDVFCNMAGNQVFCNRGGNKWSAIGDHLDRSRAYNQTNRSVLSSCLAQYGWRY